MKFIRSSVAKKFISFFIIMSMMIGGGYYVAKNYYQIESLSLENVIAIVFMIILLNLLFFFKYFSSPISNLAHEVKLLLTGKKYKRIKPKTIDEIGLFTYFFNEITINLEKISDDITKNKRLASELDIASKIQRDVLPSESPPIEGLDIVAKTTSAAEVGGDSFDLIQRGDDTFIYIGDVTGHGVPAALVMMMVNTLIRVFSAHGYSGQDMIIHTNTVLHERISSQRFMTLLMLRWDSFLKKMSWVGAGHEHLLIYRAETRDVEVIAGGGISLRMVPNISNLIQEKEIDELQQNDAILLYTDGITEAKNEKGEMFGLGRLVDSFREHGNRSTAEGIFDKISEGFADFITDCPQEDDITMIIVKRIPEGQEKRRPVKLVVNLQRDSDHHSGKKWSWKDDDESNQDLSSAKTGGV